MFYPWVGKIFWRRKWLPTLVFLPGQFHRQREPVGATVCGVAVSNMTELLTLFFFRYDLLSFADR